MEKLGWFGYFLGCYKKCFKFSGRASRTEYWSFQLFKWIIYILFLLLTNTFDIYKEYASFGFWILIILNLFADISVCIRRLHDIEVSTKQWVYLVLIPYILLIISPIFKGTFIFAFIAFYVIAAAIRVFCFTIQAGDIVENQYGLPPEDEKSQK